MKDVCASQDTNDIFVSQDTNEGKQKVVNDYVVLLCGLIDKAGSRFKLSVRDVYICNLHPVKALWETVQEQTLQEISDAIWGQVSVFCQDDI